MLIRWEVTLRSTVLIKVNEIDKQANEHRVPVGKLVDKVQCA